MGVQRGEVSPARPPCGGSGAAGVFGPGAGDGSGARDRNRWRRRGDVESPGGLPGEEDAASEKSASNVPAGGRARRKGARRASSPGRGSGVLREKASRARPPSGGSGPPEFRARGGIRVGRRSRLRGRRRGGVGSPGGLPARRTRMAERSASNVPAGGRACRKRARRASSPGKGSGVLREGGSPARPPCGGSGPPESRARGGIRVGRAGSESPAATRRREVTGRPSARGGHGRRRRARRASRPGCRGPGHRARGRRSVWRRGRPR